MKKKNPQPVLWIVMMMLMMGGIVYWVIGPSKALTSFMQPDHSSSNPSQNFFVQLLSFFGWHLQGGTWSQGSQNNNGLGQNNPSSQQMGNSNKGNQGQNAMTGAMNSGSPGNGQNSNSAGYGQGNNSGDNTQTNEGQGLGGLSGTNAENNPQDNSVTGAENNPEANAETEVNAENNPENNGGNNPQNNAEDNADNNSGNNPENNSGGNSGGGNVGAPGTAGCYKGCDPNSDPACTPDCELGNTTQNNYPIINPMPTDSEVSRSIAQQSNQANKLATELASRQSLSMQVLQQAQASKYENISYPSIPVPSNNPPPDDIKAKVQSKQYSFH